MRIKILFGLVGIIMLLGSCSKSKSYSELLTEERKSSNAYLATQRVIGEIPADSVFITKQDVPEGEEPPYYKLDEDGNVYMQVINPGTKDNKAAVNQQIYFRFMRISLNEWANGVEPTPEGNANDMGFNATSFRFKNYDLTSSIQYGTGIQRPLEFLGIDCEVNLVIKSQYGFSSEISNVIPYRYNVRYFKSQI